jgi:hypothetical protein
MTTKTIDEINFQLSQFQDAVDNVEHGFPDTDVFGDVRARSPVIHRYKIHHLIENASEESIPSRLLSKNKRINKQFDQFVSSHREVYLQALFDELDWFVSQYPQMICSFMQLDPVDTELSETLDRRDTMEILLFVLNKQNKSKKSINKQSIKHAQIKMNALDDVFKCEFENNLDDILTNHSHITRPYLPDEFWWRHPKKLK